MDKSSKCQNPHIGSLTCGVKAVTVGKANHKPFYLPLPTNRVNQSKTAFHRKPKQNCIPRWIIEISTIMKDFKDPRVVIPTTQAFSMPLLPEDRWILDKDNGFL